MSKTLCIETREGGMCEVLEVGYDEESTKAMAELGWLRAPFGTPAIQLENPPPLPVGTHVLRWTGEAKGFQVDYPAADPKDFVRAASDGALQTNGHSGPDEAKAVLEDDHYDTSDWSVPGASSVAISPPDKKLFSEALPAMAERIREELGGGVVTLDYVVKAMVRVMDERFGRSF